jgi:predicted Zn-dependent protease
MNRSHLFAGLGALAAAAGIACSDIVAPSRAERYDWRLLVPFDSAGPRIDTLTFHWPRSSLPVKIWVENQYSLPTRVREGIREWKGAFLYGEWDATLVTDSNTADVIVTSTLPPPPLRASDRSASALFVPSCQGATDVDTGSTRRQLKLPIHTYVHPSIPGAPDLDACLRVVAAHEIGHTMGLFQHSTDTLDLMFSVPSSTFLTIRDVGTAVNAYHFPSDMVPVRP